VDALFIGRADLALALGHEDIRVDAVTRATHAIIDAAKAAGKIAAMFVPNIAEREQFSAAGATCFVVGSDQSMMRQGAMALAAKKPA
jgi:2-keto-3-deoxy-L-rhamnonate aldolase RhmA